MTPYTMDSLQCNNYLKISCKTAFTMVWVCFGRSRESLSYRLERIDYSLLVFFLFFFLLTVHFCSFLSTKIPCTRKYPPWIKNKLFFHFFILVLDFFCFPFLYLKALPSRKPRMNLKRKGVKREILVLKLSLTLKIKVLRSFRAGKNSFSLSFS